MTMPEPTHSDEAMEREQLAWAAGLFEGEGCFNAHRRSDGQYSVQARLAMTDEDVVRRFAAIVGLGRVYGPISRQSGRKPTYDWASGDARDVCAVIKLLLPWLGNRRTAKAAEVAEIAAAIGPKHSDRTHCPKGHPYAGENLRLYVGQDGATARICRTCANERERQRKQRRKESHGP
jgi:hypothetical protein